MTALMSVQGKKQNKVHLLREINVTRKLQKTYRVMRMIRNVKKFNRKE